MNILIIDDSDTQRLILKSIIADYFKDSEIDEINNGADAIGLVKDKDYKLILTDINMDDVDGFEFVETVKSDNPDTVFAFITSNVTDYHQKRAKELGVEYYITKPITPAKVTEFLDKVK